LPLAGNDDGLGLRGGRTHLHQLDGGRRGRDRHRRVHHDAQLAMIGVGLAGVQVGDLGHGQQGKKDKAHDCYRREDAAPGAAAAVENCPQCCQSMTPTVPILQKNVQNWTLEA
jgi:hypothetical protein